MTTELYRSNTPSSKAGFVYIHGAGLGAWLWADLTQAFDVPQLPVSFPGRDGPSAARESLELGDYVDHVRQQIDEWSIEEVIIVAHSIGGIVGLEVAHQLRDRIAGFVGISAAIPEPGGSFLSCYPIHQRIVRRTLIRLAGTKPPDSAIRRSLCTGLSDEQTNRIIDQFTPEARRLYTDRSNAKIPDVPTMYVKTKEDNEFSPSLQDSMIATLDADDVVSINAGHLPMISHSRELAEILSRFNKAVSNEMA